MTTLAPRAGSRPRAFRLDVHPSLGGANGSLAEDARRGLTAAERWLPPKYFYDELGSDLFEQITELPEYYQSRAERSILERDAARIVERCAPTELVELGSGSSRKTPLLLDAMDDAGLLRRYIPFDVAPGMLLNASSRLAEYYPGLRVHAVAGDFSCDLPRVPARRPNGRRLVAFLGSTIGNLHPGERTAFLSTVRELMAPGDHLLMGTDLVGDISTLEAAYDDAAGVTAAFNLNVLTVLNRELDADFDIDRFEHVAFFDDRNAWIEMRVRSRGAQRVHIGALDLALTFRDGDDIRTEISCKFRMSSVADMYAGAGLELVDWMTDEDARFAVSVARRCE